MRLNEKCSHCKILCHLVANKHLKRKIVFKCRNIFINTILLKEFLSVKFFLKKIKFLSEDQSSINSTYFI